MEVPGSPNENHLPSDLLPNLNVAYRKQGDAYQQGVENDQEEEKPSPAIEESLVKEKAALPYPSKKPFVDHSPTTLW